MPIALCRQVLAFICTLNINLFVAIFVAFLGGAAPFLFAENHGQLMCDSPQKVFEIAERMDFSLRSVAVDETGSAFVLFYGGNGDGLFGIFEDNGKLLCWRPVARGRVTLEGTDV